MVRLLFLLFIFNGPFITIGQEICDNGIDDDNDLLIDLNDSDCLCTSVIPSSLIPNPSFETILCCPTANEMLECASGWIQASNPTTDFVHTCGGYLGNTSIPAFAPLPFPDGDGAVGFRDGQRFAGIQYKEYVGACLNENMITGSEYRLDFFVGFRNNVLGSRNFKMAVFGSTNCANLPFGGNNSNIGCPSNTNQYDQLGEIEVSGSNEWVNVIIEFIAEKSYAVIVLGPACAGNPNYIYDPYFYLDRLALAEVGQFGIPFESVIGSICEDDLTISVTESSGSTYQWYKDGVALVGETSHRINLKAGPDVEGLYVVTINDGNGCILSKEYELRIPPYYETFNQSICENDSLVVGDEIFSSAGYYEITIPAEDGCDSIIQLTLDILPLSEYYFEDSFCKGDTYFYNETSFLEGGYYEIVLENSFGCDSFVRLELTEIFSGAAIEIPKSVEINLGEPLIIIPTIQDDKWINFSWLNESNEIISDQAELQINSIYNSGPLFLESFDVDGCRIMDTTYVNVNKSNIRLYIPNAFSPNSNSINDYFKIFGSISLSKIKSFDIYDRWGNIVFQDKEIVNLNDFQGWNGAVKGDFAEVGVYVYRVVAEFLDGSIHSYNGDITLIR